MQDLTAFGICPEAEQIAWKAIATKQSPLPNWVFLNTKGCLQKQNDHVWIYSLYLFKKLSLEPGEYWERQEDGSKTRMRLNPDTGEKSITLLYDVPDEDRIEIFQAEANIATHQVNFIKETVLANLDPSGFELHYEEPYSQELMELTSTFWQTVNVSNQ